MAKSIAIAILNLQKEVNVGSIIRTADAASVDEIIIVGRKKWNKSAATGAHYRGRLKRIKTTDEFLDYCKENDYSIVSIEIDEKSKNIFNYIYPEKTMLVIGNEGSGVPEKVLSSSCDLVRIPQYGEIECLNAAVSASIAIYDWARKEQIEPENEIKEHKFNSINSDNKTRNRLC